MNCFIKKKYEFDSSNLMNCIELNEKEDSFLYITENFHLRIVDMLKNSKVYIKEINDSKYILSKWLKECEAIIAFTEEKVK